jgi:hypothetical protein
VGQNAAVMEHVPTGLSDKTIQMAGILSMINNKKYKRNILVRNHTAEASEL